MRTPLDLGIGLALLLVAAGCGAEQKTMDPVEFGTVRPDGTKLAIAPERGEVIPAGQWPSACKLLSDEQITALLPQAANISRGPAAVKITSILDRSQNATAAEGECHYKFRLDGATAEGITSGVIVSIRGVADPELIAEHYAKELEHDSTRTDQPAAENHGDRFGPQACHGWIDSMSTLVCREGPLMFQIRGSGYGTFAGVPTGLAARAAHWRDKVQGPVARMIADQVP